MSDHGIHFMNQTMKALTKELQVQHHKKTPYYPQENGTVEAFNKILETMLTKVCNTNCDELDLTILVVLRAYHTSCKRLTGQTAFKLVYGQEVVMPMEYIVPSLCIAAATGMANETTLKEKATQLVQLEEDRFIAGFQQCVEKDGQKVWHDHHIKKTNNFHKEIWCCYMTASS